MIIHLFAAGERTRIDQPQFIEREPIASIGWDPEEELLGEAVCGAGHGRHRWVKRTCGEHHAIDDYGRTKLIAEVEDDG